VSLPRIRLAAVLLPAALLLHQGAYALSRPAEAGGHGYLELAIPLLVALAASPTLAALLGPILLPRAAAGGRASGRLGPLAFSAALLAIFAVQELVEALLLGGGPAALGAALAGASLLLPLALLLGLVCAAAVELLGWAGMRLAQLVVSRQRRRSRERRGRRPATGRTAAVPISPLAFGLARRPPPAHA
jgi:hypothetical protein